MTVVRYVAIIIWITAYSVGRCFSSYDWKQRLKDRHLGYEDSQHNWCWNDDLIPKNIPNLDAEIDTELQGSGYIGDK